MKNIITKKLHIIILLILGICLITTPVLASFGLSDAAPSELSKNSNIAQYVGNILKGFFSLTGIIFLILSIYSGASYMLSRGDAQKAQKAREILYNSIIGLIIIMASYALTDFILTQIS